MSDQFIGVMAVVTVVILLAFLVIFVLPTYVQRLVKMLIKLLSPSKKKQALGFVIVRADGSIERVSQKTAERLEYSLKGSRKGKK
jgi:hypothetical protein